MKGNVNPYDPPPVVVDGRSPGWPKASARSVFIVAAEIAFLSLLFAPSMPHPQPYSPVEQLLVVLTSSWWRITAFVLSVASFFTIAFVGCRRFRSTGYRTGE
jgi:uncharacterized membrane protein YhaH (DUF805 family)